MIFALLHLEAEIPIRPSTSGFGRTPGLFEDVMLVLGVVFCLLIALLFWAKYIRKRSRHRSDPHVSHRVIEADGGGGHGGSTHHHHSHRRHRRDHRSRNPTLAETGGLPPPRSQDQAPPST